MDEWLTPDETAAPRVVPAPARGPTTAEVIARAKAAIIEAALVQEETLETLARADWIPRPPSPDPAKGP